MLQIDGSDIGYGMQLPSGDQLLRLVFQSEVKLIQELVLHTTERLQFITLRAIVKPFCASHLIVEDNNRI